MESLGSPMPHIGKATPATTGHFPQSCQGLPQPTTVTQQFQAVSFTEGFMKTAWCLLGRINMGSAGQGEALADSARHPRQPGRAQGLQQPCRQRPWPGLAQLRELPPQRLLQGQAVLPGPAGSPGPLARQGLLQLQEPPEGHVLKGHEVHEGTFTLLGPCGRVGQVLGEGPLHTVVLVSRRKPLSDLLALRPGGCWEGRPQDVGLG